MPTTKHGTLTKTFFDRDSQTYTAEVWLEVEGHDLPISLHQTAKPRRRQETALADGERFAKTAACGRLVKTELYLLGLGRRPASTLVS